MHQASASQPYLVTPNPQNLLGSSQRVFLSPAVWVVSVAQRGEFCRFNWPFVYCPRRPPAAERQGFKAAMPVQAGMKHRPTGYEGCLAERVVDLKRKIFAIFILEFIVNRLRHAVGSNLHHVWDAARGKFVLVGRRRNAQSNRVNAAFPVNC